MFEKFVRQPRPPRGHEIDRLDGAQGDHVVVTAAVPHDPDRPDGQEHRKGLADPVIEIVLPELVDEYVVGELQLLHVVAPQFPEHAHTEPGTREWMPVHHLVRQSEFEADLAHLVLEQLA